MGTTLVGRVRAGDRRGVPRRFLTLMPMLPSGFTSGRSLCVEPATPMSARGWRRGTRARGNGEEGTPDRRKRRHFSASQHWSSHHFGHKFPFPKSQRARAYGLGRVISDGKGNGFEESEREVQRFPLAARPACVERRWELDRSARANLVDQVLGENVRFRSTSVCVQ